MKPIESKQEYAALATEVDLLMGATEGTDEEERLSELAVRFDEYDARRSAASSSSSQDLA